MTSAPVVTSNGEGESRVTELDAVVLGAGVAGLYQLHQLREQGLRVKAFDAAGDVGGTWWWNRYPGARFDSEGYIYQYLFDEKLYKDWSWSQKFPGQPEIERWMHYITDRLDLRKDIQFGTRITSAHYDEGRGRWLVHTDQGDVVDTQFFVSCAGMLSAPLQNIPGIESFSGRARVHARPIPPRAWTWRASASVSSGSARRASRSSRRSRPRSATSRSSPALRSTCCR